MTDFCKCAHNNRDHSSKRFYQKKTCTMCDCQDYVDRNNKWHMLAFLALMGNGIILISVLSVGMFILIDAFNSLPDPSIDSQLSVTSVFYMVMMMLVGGLLVGGVIVGSFVVAMSERSEYLRPIKPL